VKKPTKIKSIKSYLSMLDVDQNDERKNGMLKRTFDCLANGSNVFLWTFLSIFGGVTKEMAVQILGQKSKAEDDESESLMVSKPELLTAIYWFRLVPVSRQSNNVLPPLLPKLFKIYFGEEPTVEVSEYFASNFDQEKYVWQDMKAEFKDLCTRIGVSNANFVLDVGLMVSEGYIGLKCGHAWGTISGLFGTGEKADRKPKVSILKSVIAAIDENPPTTRRELALLVLKCSDCTTAEELKLKYGNIGRSSFLVVRAKETDLLDPIDAEKFKEIKRKLAADLKKQSNDLAWLCNTQLKEYLVSKIGDYYQPAWSEMVNNALPVVQSKTTRNYNFVLEQVKGKSELDPENQTKWELVDAYFGSKFFAADNTFSIRKFHIGAGEELTKLWDSWNDLSDDELVEVVSAFCQSMNDDNRMPIHSLLMYLHSIREKITLKEVLDGITHGETKSKIERHKLNPIVEGKPLFNWGKSSKLSGCIIPPEEKEKHTAGKHGHDSSIWIELTVLDKDNKWVKHHFRTFNTRFYEEMYHPGTAESIPVRSRRFGFDNQVALSEEQINAIRKAPKSMRRAVKRQMRIKAARQNKQLPEFSWSEDFNINIFSDKQGYRTTFSCKIEKEKVETADVFLGFDQNQTARHTYSVLQLIGLTDPEAILFRGLAMKSIGVGYITASQLVKDKPIDQLSYDGIDWDLFQSWRDQREKFVANWKDCIGKNRKGQDVKIDVLELLKRSDKYMPCLYEYNSRYCGHVKKIMKGKSIQELLEMRAEIICFIKGGQFSVLRLSSLNHNSFDMLRNAKGIISSYFSNLLGKHSTDEQKREADEELFGLRVELQEKRQNKAKSKKNLISNRIIALALDVRKSTGSNVIIVGENISKMTSKKNKSKQNARAMDWLARGVADKIKQMSEMHEGIRFMEINPATTSHQNPLVHRNPDKSMRARFKMCLPEKMTEADFKSLVKLCKSDEDTYYTEGARHFMSHYGIPKSDMIMIPFSAFKILMTNILDKRKETSVIFPRAGGRVYLATHKIGECSPYCYDKEDVWLCNSDLVAAVNITLVGIEIERLNAAKKKAVSTTITR